MVVVHYFTKYYKHTNNNNNILILTSYQLQKIYFTEILIKNNKVNEI